MTWAEIYSNYYIKQSLIAWYKRQNRVEVINWFIDRKGNFTIQKDYSYLEDRYYKFTWSDLYQCFLDDFGINVVKSGSEVLIHFKEYMIKVDYVGDIETSDNVLSMIITYLTKDPKVIRRHFIIEELLKKHEVNN